MIFKKYTISVIQSPEKFPGLFLSNSNADQFTLEGQPVLFLEFSPPNRVIL